MNQTALTRKNKLLLILIFAGAISLQSCKQMSSATPTPEVNSSTSMAETSNPPRAKDHRQHGLDAINGYINNDNYIIFNIDIDGDGVLDKVISSTPNTGNELIFFRQTDGGFVESLVSVNFAEDGGRIIDTIEQGSAALKPESEEIIYIKTFFPKEDNSATYYISFFDDEWRLTRIVYEASDWRESTEAIYSCELSQDLPMQLLIDETWSSKIKQIPDDPAKSNECQLQRSN